MLKNWEYYKNFNRLISYEIIEVTKDSIVVKSCYEYGDEIESSYKICTMDDICALIKAGSPLNLDGCYIKNFSYPRIQQEQGNNIILHAFSANGAFFDGHTNFSGAIFDAGEKDFRNTRFGKGTVDFSKVQFGEGDVRFDASYFEEGEFNFEEAYFGNGIKSFELAQFCKGEVYFRYVAFNQGDVSFYKAHFSGGDVNFIFANFGKGRINFIDTQFDKGEAVFFGAQFGDGTVNFDCANFPDGGVDFSDITFGDGDVSFRSTHLGKGYTDFSCTKFGNGNISFWNAHFGENGVSFNQAQFGKGALSFDKARFNGGEISFEETHFGEGDVSFNWSHFSGRRVNFSSAHFGEGDISFYEAQFGEGVIDFIHTQFGEGVIDFTKAQFGEGVISFTNIEFFNKIFFYNIKAPLATLRFESCIFYQHDNFRVDELRKLEILDCILERTLLIYSTNTPKHEVKIHSLSFKNSKNQSMIYLDWETARDGIHSYSKETITTIEASSLNSAEKQHDIKNIYLQQSKQFQMLKENFHNIGEYDHEDEAFVEYMRSYRQTQSTPLRFGLWLLDKIGEYGTKPRRLSCWMGGMVLVFGVIYGILLNWQAALEDKSTFFSIGKELASKTLPDFLEHFVHGFYISAITFLTIGDNDIASRHFFSATLITAEGFFGLFLMSYFIVSLVRKTLR